MDLVHHRNYEENHLLMKILYEECNLFPFAKLFKILFLAGFYIVFFLFRGNIYFSSIIGVTDCDWVFWIIFCLIFPFSLLFHYFSCKTVKHWDRLRALASYNSNQFTLTVPKLPLLRRISILSGLLTSTTGIGVGTRMIPGLIKLGMKPFSAVATTSFFVLFVSLSYMSLAFGSRILNLGQIFYFLTLSFVSGFLVTTLINSILKHHRPGINILSLVVVSVLGIICGISNIIYRSSQNYNALLFPGNVCKI